MKCIGRIKGKIVRPAAALMAAAMVMTGLSGCGEVPIEKEYTISYGDDHNIPSNTYSAFAPMFSESLCPPITKDKGLKKVNYTAANGSGLFNIDTRKTLYADDIHKRLYPASTTKILTAYIALKELDLEKEITVGEPACIQPPGASLAGISPGDRITVRDLLYGLMLPSGNDAADALAAAVSGSAKKFKTKMNQELQLLGATNTHFCTSNGLHRDDHYTTIYDMHLIMRAALQSDEFKKIIKTTSYTAELKDSTGAPKYLTFNNTNWFLTGKWPVPDGVTVLGGKTGTTTPAGYCLVVYAKNKNNEDLISVVLGGNTREQLYALHSEILSEFGNK